MVFPTNLKRIVAQAALEYVEDNMIIGVGSGSTVYEFIDLLASSNFRVKCIPTSYDTELLLRSKRLPILPLREAQTIDIAIDGADSVLLEKGVIIKGGGGALLREKIVDYFAEKFIVIVTEEKIGRKFAVPLEILPFAYSDILLKKLSEYGRPVLRRAKNKLGPIVTDNGNWIIDVDIPMNEISKELEMKLKLIPGVLENGIFTRNATVLVARKNEKIEKKEI